MVDYKIHRQRYENKEFFEQKIKVIILTSLDCIALDCSMHNVYRNK